MALERSSPPAMPAVRPVLDEGDPGPVVNALDEAEAPLSTRDDRIAGRPIILVFCAAPQREDSAQRLQALAAYARAGGPTLLAVTPRAVAENRRWRESLSLPCRVLSDESGEIFAAYGVE